MYRQAAIIGAVVSLRRRCKRTRETPVTVRYTTCLGHTGMIITRHAGPARVLASQLGLSALAAAAMFAFGCGLFGDRPASPLFMFSKLRVEMFVPAVRKALEDVYADVRAHPESADANGRLGMVLHAHRQHEAAAVAYARAHRLQPRVFKWVYYLGEVQAANGHLVQAIATLRQAQELDPEYLPAQLKLAEILLTTGELGEAERIYGRIVIQNRDSAVAYYGLGRVSGALGDWRAALAAYNQACRLFTRYGAAHYGLALAYARLGEHEQSRLQFAEYDKARANIPPSNDPLMDRVLELNSSAAYHLERGVALLASGMTDRAAAAHERALAIDPGLSQARVNLISLYGRLGRMDKAEEQYRALLHINPNLADGHYNFGVVAMSQGRLAEAKAAFLKAIQLNPFHGEAHNDLGFILEREGHLDDALTHYRQAVVNRPDSRLARFELGRMLIDRGNYREAIQHLEKTLNPADESTPGYLYTLGIAYARSGSRNTALACWRRAKDQALALGQAPLLERIDSDLKVLEAMR